MIFPTNKISQVKKRDSRIVPFDQSKIAKAINKAFIATKRGDEKTAERISDKVTEILNERFLNKIPDIESIQDIVIETLKNEDFLKTAKAYSDYRKKRQEIREARYFLLDHDIKIKLTPNAIKVLESRYLKKDENGKIIETPSQMFRRVAENIAAAEKNYNPEISDDDLFKIEEKFYKMMANLEFLPNSPTLMNAGLRLQQLSACFVLNVPDSMSGIFDAVKYTALIHQTGGGTGFSFSKLRPKGDLVKTTQGIASGPLSFMRVFDAATEIIKQGGKRRGANMGVLRVDHPDILEFISAKETEGILSNFNISVGITDDFMKRAEKKQNYDLINPRNGQIVKQLNAKEVFDLIVKLAWTSGDPGALFIDRMNIDNPTPKLGRIESTNPCGEVPLLAFESCNLGSINLAKMVKLKARQNFSKKNLSGQTGAKKPKYEIDFKKLKITVQNAIEFLDNVVDMNLYPLPEIEAMTKGNRKVGLGVMGWADMLVRLEIPYNSNKALSLAEKIMKFISNEAKKASVRLAKKRGVFPNFKDSVYDKKNQPKVRNAALNSIAPTGTISIIAGASSSIEPYFALVYTRMAYIGKTTEGEYLLEINPLFEEIAKAEGFYSEKLMEETVKKGGIREIEGVSKKWKKIFITAQEISPEWHVKMQAAFQKYTDLAVSKTINFSKNASIEDVEKSYLLAWKLGCKGITIFRSESRQLQVITIGKKEDKKETLFNHIHKNVNPELKDPLPNEEPPIQPGSCPTCVI